ncbi:MAG: tRNA (adenosine(37)-N6)-threonylcarbamoyltransferase complex transferase subunit TsaD [Patescibacteria group bacterium]
MIVLGIETSCDETACGIVEDGKKLLSNAVFSSMDLHTAYGGVVPEIAARSHIEAIIPVIKQSLGQAKMTWDDIDGIAVTYGAGLGGCLLVGVMTARTLAITKNKPLYAINHVEAHIYVNFLTESSPALATSYQLSATSPKFPLLGLIVSGGHSQLVLWRDHFDYTLLGQTHDDAIGEAFDKVAKIIGLPYPGGPSIEKFSINGDPFAFNFPKAKMPGKYDFSFSGPKTAVLRAAQEQIGETFDFPSHKLAERLSEAQKANIAASFQRITVETVVDKTLLAYEEFQPKSVVIGGGVASSAELRRQLAARLPLPIQYTDPKLCTDNGAMIATLGCYKAMLGQKSADPYKLDIQPNLSM